MNLDTHQAEWNHNTKNKVIDNENAKGSDMR